MGLKKGRLPDISSNLFEFRCEKWEKAKENQLTESEQISNQLQPSCG